MQVHTNINDFSCHAAVTTVGIFDGVHKGHQSILSRMHDIAKGRNLESVVFTLWPHPRQVFNPSDQNLRFLTTMDEKIELLDRSGVHHLIIYPFSQEFARLSACQFIKSILVDKIQTKYLVAGYNHKFGHDQEGNYDKLKKCAETYDFEFEKLEAYAENENKVSSTLIREAILHGRMQQANRYLGYAYFITGKVVGGSKVGRKIGFPTANIQAFENYKLIPEDGVYAVLVDVNGDRFKGMLNIGIRPTVDGANIRKSVEVHLIDFDGDLYNKTIQVNFVKKVREEKKFDGIERLKNQLILDKAAVLKILA